MKSRFLTALLLVSVATLALSPVVLAHASLIESDPPDGGTLETTPYTLTATFDEELDPAASSVIVRNAAGDEVASGGVSEDDLTVMTVELPELDDGSYTVRWTAVTPDDQGVERGSYTFELAAAATPTPTASPGATATPTTAPSQSAQPSQTPTATSSPAPTSTAAPSPTPQATASPGPTTPTAGGNNDLLIALVLAGVAIGGVIGFVIWRGRS